MVNTINAKRVVFLKPEISPEHQTILTEAEDMLSRYTDMLIAKFIPKSSPSIEPSRIECQNAYRMISEDTGRHLLCANVAKIRMIVERPRFLIEQ